MPRLNGKFVSKEVYEAAMAEQENENMSETTVESTDVAEVTEEKVDRRRGERPGTALKRARMALVNAQAEEDRAQAKLDAYHADVQALVDAVDEAKGAVAAAQKVVDEMVAGQ